MCIILDLQDLTLRYVTSCIGNGTVCRVIIVDGRTSIYIVLQGCLDIQSRFDSNWHLCKNVGIATQVCKTGDWNIKKKLYCSLFW